MDFLEKDLEQIIYEADTIELNKRGLSIKGKLFRQKKIGNYGIADLISVKRSGRDLEITVFELKKEKIGIYAFLQAIEYAKGIENYLNTRGINCYMKITLIGKNIDRESTFIYLESLLFNKEGDWFLELYTYHYGLDGLTFKAQSGYSLSKEGF